MSNVCRRQRLCVMAILTALLCASSLLAKDKKAPAAPERSNHIKVASNVVALTATVTDIEGNPVNDLTLNDFKVYDDGKPQTVETMSLASVHPSGVAKTQDAGAFSGQAEEKRSDDTPRMISIVVDDLTMNSVLEFPRIIDAVKKFIDKEIRPTDQAALLAASRRVQAPFSTNKQELLTAVAAALEKFNKQPILRAYARTYAPGGPGRFASAVDTLEESQKPYDPWDRGSAEITDLAAWNISHGSGNDQYYFYLVCLFSGRDCTPQMILQHKYSPYKQIKQTDGKEKMEPEGQATDTWSKEEEMIQLIARRVSGDSEFQTMNLLNALEQHIRMLRHFKGNKSIVLFSDGFLSLQDTKLAYQMQKIVDLALRAGIVLNTVSTRGITLLDMGEVTDPNNQWMISMREDEKQVKHNSLEQMAEATGGLFFQDNNYLKPLQTIANRKASHYALSYVMPPHKPDGAYHRIKLEVARPGLQVVYRKGYYTQKETLTYENTKRQDIIDAINTAGNMNEIPISLSYSYSRGNDREYSVSFATGVNIKSLQFPAEQDRRLNQISLVLAVYDAAGNFISGLEKAIDFQLLESSYDNLRNRGLASKVELKLPAGRYKIKAIVREGVQGKMGSINKTVDIP